jgi:hypothetical protein
MLPSSWMLDHCDAPQVQLAGEFLPVYLSWHIVVPKPVGPDECASLLLGESLKERIRCEADRAIDFLRDIAFNYSA